MKRLLVSIVLSVGIIAAGGLLVYGVWAKKQANPDEREVRAERVPNVAVQIVERTDVDQLLGLTGRIDPWEDITLSAETTGRIEWQGVEEGQTVKAGQELLKVNVTSIHARRSQAQAEYRLTQLEYDRLVRLREGGISSPQEFDKAAASRQAARARLDLIEIELAQSTVRSQFDGIVDTLHKKVGEFASIGTPLVRIVQVDKLKVLVGIPERDVVHFAIGDHVDFIVDAYPARYFQGAVSRIATTAETATRTFIAEIALDNREGLFKPGMIARALLVQESYPDAISIPLFTVLSQEDTHYVVIEQDGVAEIRPVTVGFYQDGKILIAAGLEEGDRLVVTGHRDLHDGQRVRVGRVTNGAAESPVDLMGEKPE